MTSYRVRRPRRVLAPGEQRDREAQLLAALSEEAHAGVAAELADLGMTDRGWYNVLAARRWIELLAWANLAAQGAARGLTPRAAQDRAAQQLGLAADTLRTRLRGAAVNPTAR